MLQNQKELIRKKDTKYKTPHSRAYTLRPAKWQSNICNTVKKRKKKKLNMAHCFYHKPLIEFGPFTFCMAPKPNILWNHHLDDTQNQSNY